MAQSWGSAEPARVLSPDQLTAALAVALTLLVLLAMRALRRGWRSWRARRRGRRAHGKERAARKLLEREGFKVRGAQVRRTWTVSLDGEAVGIELRADYLVTRGARRYVADVKTGDRATKITTAATRRQLLEYFVAYDVSGVLLVDMEAERVHDIGFELSSP